MGQSRRLFRYSRDFQHLGKVFPAARLIAVFTIPNRTFAQYEFFRIPKGNPTIYEVGRCACRAPAQPHLAMKVDFSPSTDVLLDESGNESELAYWDRGKSLSDLGGPILVLQAEFLGPLLLPRISRKVDNHGLTPAMFLDLV